MHLKDNTIVNLGKSLPQPEVIKIISKLFGESGILALEDQVTFDEIRDELTHSYDIPYLSNRLLPNLEQFAFKPQHIFFPYFFCSDKFVYSSVTLCLP